ncbi:hypothetical protein GCM10020254_10460 [Streptomyces goshikiensis]
MWERTAGNALDASTPGGGDWLLQTPGCWGDATCATRPGSERLLSKMTENISHATRTVDISTLAPFPNGAFQDAVVAGLKNSAAGGNKLKVRILVGAAPLYHFNVVPSKYRDELVAKLGADARNIDLNVASMTTSKTAFSWNHSKLLVVDGQSVVTGGINSWKDDYLETTHPVADVDLALKGPAAASAGRYLDELWSWTCQNKSNIASVWFASSNGAACMPTLPKSAAAPAPAGDVPAIAVGGLGVGIMGSDPCLPVPARPADGPGHQVRRGPPRQHQRRPRLRHGQPGGERPARPDLQRHRAHRDLPAGHERDLSAAAPLRHPRLRRPRRQDGRRREGPHRRQRPREPRRRRQRRLLADQVPRGDQRHPPRPPRPGHR